MNNIYYVYMYLRDTTSANGSVGSPYYIGKGKGVRAYKKNRKEIRPNKDKSNIQFIIENISEDEAHMWEEFWIDFFGRIDLRTGCLHNKTNGGEGLSGAIHTAAWNLKVSQAKKGKIPKKRSAESYKNQGLKFKGTIAPKLTCPHCSLSGGKGAMLRWYFNNCKMSNGLQLAN